MLSPGPKHSVQFQLRPVLSSLASLKPHFQNPNPSSGAGAPMNRLLLSRSLDLSRNILRSPPPPPILPIFAPKLRLFSSSSEPPPPTDPQPESASSSDSPPNPVASVDNAELKRRIDLYLHGHDEQALPSIFEAVLSRRLAGDHHETDDELLEELRDRPPVDDVKDEDIQSDFEALYETEDELECMLDVKDHVKKKKMKDEFFDMDDKKWDDMVQDAIAHGVMGDMKECEGILEDMVSYHKLLPDEIKKKVEAKFNELGDMCERGEMEPEKAYELFKQFEDEMVVECTELMEADQPPAEDEITKQEKKSKSEDPPGEGPVLRWESRVVLVPGMNSWHPKNRLVKLRVTVKELGLSRHASRRLREVVAKRYNSGKDELTITSERFEHREENRKDCLRTLYALIDDARKADKLVEEARTGYVKDRLRANPQFMERLRAKTAKIRGELPASL